MSTAKHTPGPWAVDTIDGHVDIGPNVDHAEPEMLGASDIYIRGAGQPVPFGLVYGDLEKRERLTRFNANRNLANARLIAAAPEMLEALKALLWQHDNHGQLFGMALQDARATIAKAEGS